MHPGVPRLSVCVCVCVCLPPRALGGRAADRDM